MKLCIPTLNDMFGKWRSKMSHVGKVMIVLFWHNAWILLLAPCMLLLTLISDCAYVLRGPLRGCDEAYQACDKADCKDDLWRVTLWIHWRWFMLPRTWEHLTIVSRSRTHYRATVRSQRTTFRATVMIIGPSPSVSIYALCRNVNTVNMLTCDVILCHFSKICYTGKVCANQWQVTYTWTSDDERANLWKMSSG